MKATGFSIRLSPKELKYLLFRRKICPYCFGKLIKRRVGRIVEGRDIEYVNEKFFRDNQLVKIYTYEFTCNKCGNVFSLTDIANWNWSP